MKKTKKILLSALACLTAGVSVLGASSCALHDSIHNFVRPACGKAFLWKTDGSLYYKLSIDQKSFSVVAINNIDGKTELSIPSSYQGRP
ncbi:MAG: hypothetical protein J6A46_01385, partial [Clostridia bacterium]|nr:hypothetical protein [Clostridia bacterium]